MKTKRIAAVALLLFAVTVSQAQTNYTQNEPAIGLGVVQDTGFPYSFTYESRKVGHYALGWYDDSQYSGAPTAYLSGFGGIRFFLGGSPKVYFASSGNVGIGTTTPQAKLAVNGNILAKEVKVKTDISVPDYVFEPDYELPTLEEIETYVKEHKHLPEIPSAADIEKDGLDLGEMNLLLLKKVEELTLHLMDMKIIQEQQNERIKSLEIQQQVK
ncbi:hypothetical protein [Parapedobacter sp. DT-150]|uniref:hypothetical protein n=1 Tax=Parapedobacter sp. DT-150 TaxID=3396162 RepID=UPI003F1CDAE5